MKHTLDKSVMVSKCVTTMFRIRTEYDLISYMLGRSDWITRRDGEIKTTTITSIDDPIITLKEEDKRVTSSIRHISGYMRELAEIVSPGALDQVILDVYPVVEDGATRLALNIHMLPTNKHMDIVCGLGRQSATVGDRTVEIIPPTNQQGDTPCS